MENSNLTASGQTNKTIKDNLFQVIWNSSKDASRVSDSSGIILKVNDAYCKLVDMKKEELEGNSIAVVFKKEYQQHVIEGYINSFNTKIEDYKFETEAKLWNKTEKWFEVESRFIYISEKEKIMLSVFVDITEKKQFQKKIEEISSQFLALLNAIPEAIALKDLNGIYLTANKKFCELFNIPYNDIAGKKDNNVLPKDIIKLSTINDKKAIALNESKSFDCSFANNLNIKISLKVMKSPIKDANDMITGIVEAFIDVSKITESLEKIKQDELRLHLALESTSSGTWELDPRTMKGIFGKNYYSLLGYDYSPDASNPSFGPNTIHPDDIDFVLLEYDKFINGRNEFLEVEYRKVKKNGEIIWVLDRGKLIGWDEENRPKRIIGTIVDITGRKLEQQESLQNEKKFRLFFNAANDAIFILDFKGNIIELNDAAKVKVGKLKSDDSEGVVNAKLNLSKFIDKLDEKINKIRNDSFAIFEAFFTMNDGSKTPFEINAKIIKYQDKDLILAIARDISEKKEYENSIVKAKEKAEEMNRLKTIFMENMNHELRTPLVGILGFSEIIYKEYNEPELIQIGKIIHESGERLLRSLNLILNFSKAESEINSKKLKDENIVPIVKHSFDEYSELAQRKNLEFEFVASKQEIFLNTDATLLGEISANLIDNAIKFTQKGNVKVEVIDFLREVTITISDTGIGIPENAFISIFEEFRQVHEGTLRCYEGNGLGLTISKKYTEALEGKISVKSKINEGSVFTICFPKSLDSYNVQSEADVLDSSNSISGLKKKKVLVVEDEQSAVKIISRFLGDTYTIDVAISGEDAIQKLGEHKYDVVLLDINLGKDISGIEVLNDMRSKSENLSTPAIAVTAYAVAGDKENYLSAGFNQFLAKPFNRKDLLTIVNSVVR